MKKTMKIFVFIDIFCIVTFCLFLFCLQHTNNKIDKLSQERFILVERYMIENNLPTLDDTLILDFLNKNNNERKEKERLRFLYETTNKQIYQEEQKAIDSLRQISYILDKYLLVMFWLFCVLTSFIILYFIIAKTPIKKHLKRIDFKNNLNQIIPIVASIIFLLLAIFEIEIIDEDAFYSLLKIVVSATLFYISFIIKNSKSILFWLAISLGILFNPIVQIHLKDSDLWNTIDICTIIYLIAYTVTKLQRIK